MLKYFLLTICFLSIGLSAVAMDETETPSFSREDKAARTLQRRIRNHHFQTNKQKVFEEMYKEGLLYRDGKVQGYSKDSFDAMARAAAHFFPLAYQGDAKAQHNLAMIYYQRGNYDLAHKWFSMAASNGLEPSQRNLKRIEVDERMNFILCVQRNQLSQLNVSDVLNGIKDMSFPYPVRARLANYLLHCSCLEFPEKFLEEFGFDNATISIFRMTGAGNEQTQITYQCILANWLLKDEEFKKDPITFRDGKVIHTERSVIPSIVPLVMDRRLIIANRLNLFNQLIKVKAFNPVVFPNIFAELLIDTDFDLADYRQPIADVFFKLRDSIALEDYKKYFLAFFREISRNFNYVRTFLPKLTAYIHFSTMEEIENFLPYIRKEGLPIDIRSLSLSMLLSNNPFFSRDLSAEVLMMINDPRLCNTSKASLAAPFLKHAGSEIQSYLPIFLKLFEDQEIEAKHISPKFDFLSQQGTIIVSASRFGIAKGLLTNPLINIQDYFNVFEQFIGDTMNEYPIRLYISAWLLIHNNYTLTFENLPLFKQFALQPKLAKVEAFVLQQLCNHSNQAIAESISKEVRARSIVMPLECTKLEDILDIKTAPPSKLSSKLFDLDLK